MAGVECNGGQITRRTVAEGKERAKGTLGLGWSGIGAREGTFGEEELEDAGYSMVGDGLEKAIASLSSLSRP